MKEESVEIYIEDFDETYTAHIQKKSGVNWFDPFDQEPIGDQALIGSISRTLTSQATHIGGKNWIGSIPDVPEVTGKASTKERLLETLKDKLYEVLRGEEEAWQTLFSQNSEGLHSLAAEAVREYQNGKCYTIDELKELL